MPVETDREQLTREDHPIAVRFVEAMEAILALTEQATQVKKAKEVPDDWDSRNVTVDSVSSAPATAHDCAQVCGRNELRYDVTILNTGTNNVYLVRNNVGQAIEVVPGASWTFGNKGPIWAYSVGGSTLSVVEQVYSNDDRKVITAPVINRMPRPVPASFLE